MPEFTKASAPRISTAAVSGGSPPPSTRDDTFDARRVELVGENHFDAINISPGRPRPARRNRAPAASYGLKRAGKARIPRIRRGQRHLEDAISQIAGVANCFTSGRQIRQGVPTDDRNGMPASWHTTRHPALSSARYGASTLRGTRQRVGGTALSTDVRVTFRGATRRSSHVTGWSRRSSSWRPRRRCASPVQWRRYPFLRRLLHVAVTKDRNSVARASIYRLAAEVQCPAW